MAFTTPRTWVAAETVTAALLNTHIRDNQNAMFPSGVEYADYTPSHSGITVGNGTEVARFIEIGEFIHAVWQLTWGSTTSITSSAAFVGLPANIGALANAIVEYRDASGIFYPGAGYEQSNRIKLGAWNTASTYASITALTGSIPFTWTTSDIMRLSVVYEKA